jgi:hypothetical protein
MQKLEKLVVIFYYKGELQYTVYVRAVHME